jgi:hypothetical protein
MENFASQQMIIFSQTVLKEHYLHITRLLYPSSN